METNRLSPSVERLAMLIDAAALLLRREGEHHWATWLEKDARLIRRLELEGVEDLLRAFGGTGSLNDLASQDRRLRRLLELIYRLASRLRREELLASLDDVHSGSLENRLLAIGRDCAARVQEPFRSVDHGELLYDERGLPW